MLAGLFGSMLMSNEINLGRKKEFKMNRIDFVL